MEKSKTSNRYSPEMRARAVRMVLEHQGSYETQSAAVAAIAPKIGCIPETLKIWVRQAERDSGMRDGATSAERNRIKDLEREVKQLRQANEILRKGEPVKAHWFKPTGERIFCAGQTRPPIQAMIAFIDDHRTIHGVESICRTLQIAPSGYYARLAVRADPSKASARQQRDAVLRPKIKKVWNDNWQVYGVRKTWRQLCREGEAAARCTVARLMASMGLRGIVRGKTMKTTIPDPSVPCPRDKVNRKFRAPAPNMLWVSDFSYVSTWQGFVYVAPRHWARTNGAFNGSMIDTFANRIVGWKTSRSAKTDFVLDAFEQALYARRPAHQSGLIHHSDRGGQYVSIRYTERLGKAGIEPSVGSVGDAYDNALAETINGLYKTEVIRRRSSWKTMGEVELETLKWVDWLNNRRLLEPIGNIPPAEAEEAFYANLITLDMVA